MFLVSCTSNIPQNDNGSHSGLDTHVYIYIYLDADTDIHMDMYIHLPYGSKYPNMKHIPQNSITIPKEGTICTPYLGTEDP